MSWRIVVISKRSKLDLNMNYMVVRKDMETKKIFLGEISTVIIEDTSVSLTVSLLNELINRKIKVMFCDEKRNPSSELTPYYGSHDTSVKIKYQLNWTDEFKEFVWTEIVTEKIRKQAQVLERLNKEGYKLLHKYIEGIKLNDETNREGHAAKVYFNSLFGHDFTRNCESNINSALNYGYTIILSAFNREIVSNGYITQLGLFHNNMFNNFNLSSDLMEPFRPLVDMTVIDMKLDKFEREEKIELINILNKEVYIDSKKQFVNNAIKIYCKSIFDSLNERDISLIKFYRNE